jgi:hypothetical protein
VGFVAQGDNRSDAILMNDSFQTVQAHLAAAVKNVVFNDTEIAHLSLLARGESDRPGD